MNSSSISALLYKLQPSFIKVKNNEILPQAIRNQFMVCLPFPNMQDEFGEIKTKTVNGIPAIMICLDSICDEDQYDIFLNFILTVQADPLKIFFGTDDFYLGEDYYITESFYRKFYRKKTFLTINNGDGIDNDDTYLMTNDIIKNKKIAINEAEMLKDPFERHKKEYFDYILPDFCTFGQDVVFNTFYYDKFMFDSNAKDFNNLEYFYRLNTLNNSVYKEEELNAFYSTFCKIILKYTDYDPETTKDVIYEKVLKFFAKNQMDETLENINLLLGDTSNSFNKPKCACGATDYNYNYLGQLPITSTSNCSTSYQTQMHNYLKEMLGDKDFYKNFFFLHYDIDGNKVYPTYIAINNGDGKDNDTVFLAINNGDGKDDDKKKIITEVDGEDYDTYITDLNLLLVNSLITLINEFLELEFTLDFDKPSSSYSGNCPKIDSSKEKDECNRKIINNYLKVLEFVKGKQIDTNQNKIKIYGQQFGELLPKLNF